MMFVYYDDEMTIVSISPVEDSEFSNINVLELDLDIVLPFLNGEKNILSYQIGKNKEDITKLTIVPKSVIVAEMRSSERFLSEIKKEKKYEFLILNNLNDKTLKFSLTNSFKESLLGEKNVRSENITVNGTPELAFYFTKKNDPNFLVKEVVINTSELLGKEYIEISYEENLKTSSLFTKKVFDSYSYEIKK